MKKDFTESRARGHAHQRCVLARNIATACDAVVRAKKKAEEAQDKVIEAKWSAHEARMKLRRFEEGVERLATSVSRPDRGTL